MGTGTYLVGTQNSVSHKSHGKCEAEGHEEGPPLSRRRRPLLQNQLTDSADATSIRKVITQSIFICLLRGKTGDHSRSYHERTIGVGHCRHNEPAPGAGTPFFTNFLSLFGLESGVVGKVLRTHTLWYQWFWVMPNSFRKNHFWRSETAIVGIMSQPQVPKLLFSNTSRGGISYRVVLLEIYYEQAHYYTIDFGLCLTILEKIIFEGPKRPLSA